MSMAAVTDFHSHILPGIDDGSTSTAESVAMLRMEAEQGVTHVIATPHFVAQYDTPEAFLQKRAEAEAQLRREMEGHPELPQVTVGAEVSFFRGMSETEYLPQLVIEGTNCILVEMPPAPWPDEIYRELEKIWTNWKITPVIAHIDRCIGRFRTYGIPGRLARLPVLVQVNGKFFLRPSTTRRAMRMLKAGQIHLIGSDCHNLTGRKPNLGPVMEKIRSRLGDAALEQIRKYEDGLLER